MMAQAAASSMMGKLCRGEPGRRGARTFPRLLDSDDHRVGTGERNDLGAAEARFLQPSLAVSARVVKTAWRFDEHVEAAQQA